MLEELFAEFVAFLILGTVYYAIAFCFVKIKEKLKRERKKNK